MTLIRIPRGWEIPEREATTETVYMNRRKFIEALGLGSLGVLGLAAGLREGRGQDPKAKSIYPAKRNPNFTLDRPITKEDVAARYNNFYEFNMKSDQVWRFVDKFQPKPWQVEVAGLVEKPKTYDLDDLIRRMPVEERLYRHRCVETWAMAVPWTGFPMKAFINEAKPKSNAKYLRMVSFLRPDQAPGQKSYTWYPWPYFEALTMAEATNELTFLAIGIYGHELPKQHGAPLRLVTPWKYGLKSIKSIVRFEFADKQPPTFWNQLQPNEYDFLSNVNPKVPHPRWSQATEWMIDTKERRPTLLYNGYEKYVAQLYRKS